jgi:hypothetical protein
MIPFMFIEIDVIKKADVHKFSKQLALLFTIPFAEKYSVFSILTPQA